MTYGASLHKGTGAVAIRVNKMNFTPMSIRFTQPTHGHLSSKQIRAEIYDLLLVAPSVLQHDATYVGKHKKRPQEKKKVGYTRYIKSLFLLIKSTCLHISRHEPTEVVQ